MTGSGTALVLVAVAAMCVCVCGRSVHSARNHHQVAMPKLNASHLSSHLRQSGQTIMHHNISAHSIAKRIKGRKETSTWQAIKNTITENVISDEDSSDSSSQSSSESQSENVSERRHRETSKRHVRNKQTKKHGWGTMARSAVAEVTYRLLSSLWPSSKRRRKSKKPRRKIRRRMQRTLSVTTLAPMEADEEGVEEEEEQAGSAMNAGMAADAKGASEGGNEEQTNQINKEINQLNGEELERKSMEERLYKITNGGNILQKYSSGSNFLNSLQDLADLEREVEASGRRLSFIEYAAILEIVVLSVIAAGVFRSASLPVPIPVFAKI